MMKKILLISFLLLALMLPTGCDTPPGDQADLTVSPIIGEFTPIDLPDDRSRSKSYQLTEDTMLISDIQYGTDYTIENIVLSLYDLNQNLIIKELAVPNDNDSVAARLRICEDKIIIKNEKAFCWVDLELSQVSEPIALPDFIFENTVDDGFDYGPPTYDVAADLRHIIYNCLVKGTHYYDLQTGENRLLFAPKQEPYWYEPDWGLWQSPTSVSFLPGDQKFAFEKYGEITTIGLDGKILWTTDFDQDEYDSVWDPNIDAPVPGLRTNRHSEFQQTWTRTYVALADLQEQTQTEYRPTECEAGTIIEAYNDNYFAYQRVIRDPKPETSENYIYEVAIVDLATLTAQTVLSYEGESSGFFNISGITDNGQLLFSWPLTDGASYYASGLTPPLR